MDNTLLSIKDLESGYGDVQVLWGLDMDVRDGEITAVIGSNGAGKSTLMRTLSGLVKVKKGHITFAGQDLTSSEDQALGYEQHNRADRD